MRDQQRVRRTTHAGGGVIGEDDVFLQAVAKALADGSDAVEKDEHGNYYVFNDYYIRNVNKLIRTFPLAPGCTISVVDPEDPGNLTETVSFDEFRTRMVEEPLMHVKVVGGVIVSMTQQFIP